MWIYHELYSLKHRPFERDREQAHRQLVMLAAQNRESGRRHFAGILRPLARLVSRVRREKYDGECADGIAKYSTRPEMERERV